MMGVEKGAPRCERCADRSALGKRGPTKGGAHRHKYRVERDDRAGADLEQQGMNPINALERFSVPSQRFQDAIQRM